MIGYSSYAFGNCFQVLTEQTLFHYICERKMYYASRDLQNHTEKSIVDIALDYGYSDQTAFSRAFKAHCNASPYEVRKGKVQVPDNKKYLNDICKENHQCDTRFERIIEAIKRDEYLSMNNWRYLENIEEARQEYGFDVDTCDAIADLAERLEIPFMPFLRKCGDMFLDYRSSLDYLPPKIEAAIDCGINSSEELAAICKFYECKYYDLDVFMVNAYREQVKSN